MQWTQQKRVQFSQRELRAGLHELDALPIQGESFGEIRYETYLVMLGNQWLATSDLGVCSVESLGHTSSSCREGPRSSITRGQSFFNIRDMRPSDRFEFVHP